MRLPVLLALISAAICCCCVGTYTTLQQDRLEISLDYPQSVYSGEVFSVYMDVKNLGNLSYNGMIMEFFNTGSFSKQNSCTSGTTRLGPNGMATVECRLKYERQIESPVTETVDSLVAYERNMTSSLAVPVLSEDEYGKRRQLGTYQELSKIFSQSNNEITVDAELSENPVVDIGGEKYVYFTIRNTGSGFINEIKKADISVWSVPLGIVSKGDCNIPVVLFHDNGVFTKIACRMHPESVQNGFENAFVFFDVNYIYELRQSVSITVKR